MSERRERRMSIADSPTLLTPAWLTEVLGAPVADVHHQPVGTGPDVRQHPPRRSAFDGAVPEGTPTSVIAKLPAADPTSRATGLALRSYEIEVRFYQELAPTLPMRTPRCSTPTSTSPTGSFVLLLEDMRPARQGDQLVGCDAGAGHRRRRRAGDAARAALGRPGPRRHRVAAPRPRGEQASMSMQLLPMLWAGFRDRYADRLGPEVHEAGEALFASFESYLPRRLATAHRRPRRLPPRQPALRHRRPAACPSPWSTGRPARTGTALHDVAYFIGAGLLAERRRELGGDLVRRYHDGLARRRRRRGTAGPACWEGYRRGTFAGLIMAIGASMLVEQTDRGDEMFMAMAHRHARHALDLDAPALL